LLSTLRATFGSFATFYGTFKLAVELLLALWAVFER
jgi:hypothetical protein